jgi:putative membrane protein
MNRPLTSTVLAMLAGLGLAGSVLAQSGQAAPSPGQTATTERAPAKTERTTEAKVKLGAADVKFLKQAAQNGMAEVEAGKLAQTKATSADVKSFAQHMIDDHTQANDELSKLASAKGVDVPAGPSIAQKAKLKMLAGSDGEKFNKRYADNFGAKAHEETLKLFRSAAEKAQDADVKAFAQKTLAKLEQHLTMAQTMQAVVAPERKLGSGTSSGPSAPDKKP